MLLVAGLSILAGYSTMYAQTYSTQTGSIHFYSKAKLEDIEAETKQATSLLDASTGEIAFIVLIKSFEFDKALMQEHFNENYMHSDKFPKSTFSGKITNISAVNFAKNGTYTVEVEGKLTIHGVTKDVKEKGELTVDGNNIKINSRFTITLADYDIKNDKIQNISDKIDISVNAVLAKK